MKGGNGRSNKAAAGDSLFAIQSGIPIPSRRKHVYPWEEMLDGDSFVVACAADERRQVQRRVYIAGRNFCKKNRSKAKIVTRLEEAGVRVWLEER